MSTPTKKRGCDFEFACLRRQACLDERRGFRICDLQFSAFILVMLKFACPVPTLRRGLGVQHLQLGVILPLLGIHPLKILKQVQDDVGGLTAGENQDDKVLIATDRECKCSFETQHLVPSSIHFSY